MKVLIIQRGNLGQCMAVASLASSICSAQASASVHVVCGTSMEWFFNRCTSIEKVFSIEGDTTQVLNQLLQERYAYVLNASAGIASKLMVFHLRQQFNSSIKQLRFPPVFLLRYFFKKHKLSNQYTTLLHQSCKTLGVSGSHAMWQLPLLDADTLSKDDLPISHSAGYYVIDVACISSEAVQEKICNYNFPVIIVGQQKENAIVTELKSREPIKIYDACGKFSEPELLQILMRSSLNIVHSELYCSLAIAAQKPLLNAAVTDYACDVEPYKSKGGVYYEKINVSDAAKLNAAIDFVLRKK